ncbi:8-amino-7-oxononanoate synthase [Pseudofrankia sp. DC12]|uniref:8-amino-7-oxononanoate synthase n=1 Tax=Pseudofrankia sp. DC12 TaxID=683315 RepID=UPI0005F76AF0|nr:8-amino-7-oxononanoate synthase [Pseudofrankia sp. DC12]
MHERLSAPPAPLAWLDANAQARRIAGLRRSVLPRPAVDHRIRLDLAGNDYLGLARHPDVIEAGVAALRAWGAGSTGSRLVSGTTELHAELEAELAAHCGFAAGLVFASGYAANLGALTALASAGDLVVSDEHNHASIVDACRLSRAEVAVVPHLDVTAVDAALARRSYRRALVVTDSVFSADGDLAQLAELHAATRRHGAVLLVDEAHALGVVGTRGEGAAAAAGLAGEPDVVATVTLSKSLGSQGGAVLGPIEVRDHLIDTARTFIFDTGLAPAAAGAALGALRLLVATPALAARARARAGELARIADAPAPAAAVVSVVLGEPERAVAAAETCREHGVAVGCFRPPTVPPGTSRLRLSARADLTDDDVALFATALSAARAAQRT